MLINESKVSGRQETCKWFGILPASLYSQNYQPQLPELISEIASVSSVFLIRMASCWEKWKSSLLMRGVSWMDKVFIG